jgi:putative hydrolase of the HAD superfamily
MDVAGARAAGMRVAWLNRERQPWPAALGAPPELDAADLGVVAVWLEAQAGA